MTWLSKNWKAVLAFVALLLTNIVTNAAAANGNPLDYTWAQWVSLIVTTIGGTVAVYSKGNRLDIGQVVKAVEASHITLDQLRMILNRFLPTRSPAVPPKTPATGGFIPVNTPLPPEVPGPRA